MLRGVLTDQRPVRSHRGSSVDVDGAPAFNVDGEHCGVQPGCFTTAGRVALVVPS
jgi:hypothetical protein